MTVMHYAFIRLVFYLKLLNKNSERFLNITKFKTKPITSRLSLILYAYNTHTYIIKFMLFFYSKNPWISSFSSNSIQLVMYIRCHKNICRLHGSDGISWNVLGIQLYHICCPLFCHILCTRNTR